MPEDIAAPRSIARHLVVHGRVQGVCYRAGAQAEASRLGLRGWVRNRRDGTVEALVEGPSADVEAFIAWARKGPRSARVDNVVVTAAEISAVGAFSIHPSV